MATNLISRDQPTYAGMTRRLAGAIEQSGEGTLRSSCGVSVCDIVANASIAMEIELTHT